METGHIVVCLGPVCLCSSALFVSTLIPQDTRPATLRRVAAITGTAVHAKSRSGEILFSFLNIRK